MSDLFNLLTILSIAKLSHMLVLHSESTGLEGIAWLVKTVCNDIISISLQASSPAGVFWFWLIRPLLRLNLRGLCWKLCEVKFMVLCSFALLLFAFLMFFYLLDQMTFPLSIKKVTFSLIWCQSSTVPRKGLIRQQVKTPVCVDHGL